MTRFLTRPSNVTTDDILRPKNFSHTLTDAKKEVITRAESVAKEHNVEPLFFFFEQKF